MKIKLPYNKLLADPTRTFGVRRLDTGEVVVPLDSDATLDYALFPLTDYELGLDSQLIEIGFGLEQYVYPVLGGLIEADEFFATRLHINQWSDASREDRAKAILSASNDISRLRFKGYPQFSLQTLPFPRDLFGFPDDIKQATFLIAHAYVSGVNLDSEIQNLRVTSRRFSSVGTTYGAKATPDYLAAGIVSQTAWNTLLPYLSTLGGVKLHRVS
jgi:hypothetical protein